MSNTENTDLNTIAGALATYFEDSFNDNKSGEYTEEIQEIESAWGRVSEAAKSYLYDYAVDSDNGMLIVGKGSKRGVELWDTVLMISSHSGGALMGTPQQIYDYHKQGGWHDMDDGDHRDGDCFWGSPLGTLPFKHDSYKGETFTHLADALDYMVDHCEDWWDGSFHGGTQVGDASEWQIYFVHTPLFGWWDDDDKPAKIVR